jgi:hypothetical protein
MSLGANLPTGKQDLTIEEFTTLFLLAQNAFDFTVPGFGHGLGISPSIALALPVNPNVVMGIGASYQHRGGYRPVDFLQEDYQPGSELLLTGGMDFRVNPSTSFSLDATFTMYQADRIGDLDVYESGGKTTLTAMVRQVRGFNEWRLIALYRSRAKSNELAGAELVAQDERTIPNQLLLRGSYAARLSASLTAVLLAEGRFFDETEIYPGRNVFDLGVLPQLRLGESAVLLTRFVYTLGTITGIEAGGGLSISL